MKQGLTMFYSYRLSFLRVGLHMLILSIYAVSPQL